MIVTFVSILLLISGLFSALTIAYMGFDLGVLHRLAKQKDKNAIAILAIRSNGMRLLITLILGTTLANAFATILIGDQFSGFVAGIVSASLIFLLADVLPQAFGSRYALAFGGFCAPLVKVFLFIFYPISAPVAYLLKYLLGEEKVNKLSKIDLLTILEESDKSGVTDVDTDERRIARGSLQFSDRRVNNVMTPNTVVKTISHDEVIDHDRLIDLRNTGYSRIPVYENNQHNFTGILYLKDLIGIDVPCKVSSIMDNTIHFVHSNDPLDKVLSEFISTKMHLFVVLDEFGGFEGVITVEDILEEIIGQEIMDEDDVIPDLRQYAKARQKNKMKK
ncbi:MAG: metal transporter [Patescibacteria group bacterium]|jgi:metal transporter CNNM|nr:metal transporter [Patescibacteria group bacterium]